MSKTFLDWRQYQMMVVQTIQSIVFQMILINSFGGHQILSMLISLCINIHGYFFTRDIILKLVNKLYKRIIRILTILFFVCNDFNEGETNDQSQILKLSFGDDQNIAVLDIRLQNISVCYGGVCFRDTYERVQLLMREFPEQVYDD